MPPGRMQQRITSYGVFGAAPEDGALDLAGDSDVVPPGALLGMASSLLPSVTSMDLATFFPSRAS